MCINLHSLSSISCIAREILETWKTNSSIPRTMSTKKSLSSGSSEVKAKEGKKRSSTSECRPTNFVRGEGGESEIVMLTA